MGLDTVGLVMAIEDEFRIDIPDEVAAEMQTVGHVHDYVVTRLGKSVGVACPTAHTYYRLRRALTDVLGSQREGIRPSTELDSILPTGRRRRAVWAQLATTSGLTLPPLYMQTWVVDFAKWSLYGAAALATAASLPILGWMSLAFGALVGLVLFLVVLVAGQFARFLETELPPAWHTVGGLARVATAMNLPTVAWQQNVPRVDADVWRRLQTIVCRELGVSPDEVTPEARFVDDLGCS